MHDKHYSLTTLKGLKTYSMRRCSRSPRVNGIDPEKSLPDRSLETKNVG